jgi:tetratricopeptide (TPR) repeat protein
VYHDELATTLGSLSLAAIDAKNATQAAALAKQSLAESDSALRTSPKNVNFWKTRTKLYYTFSTFDPQLNTSAIQALEMAQTLSPNDPKILYNLAILYGRGADNAKAVQLLEKAKALKPDYRDAYFGLYVFYTEMKQPDTARAQLQYYLDHVDPTDKDFQSRLTQ